jgi:nickel/cobalt exporter
MRVRTKPGLARPALVAGLALFALAIAGAHAFAQGPNPFAVAGNEGSASPEGIGGFILAWQTYFYRLITGAVRATRHDGGAVWSLMGIGFAYGVLHAAGPGHGKAVVASYMVANERALKRGVAISFFAAFLQGCVAVLLVTAAALVLRVTADRITQASEIIDKACFTGVAVLGAWLVWRKGRALFGPLAPRGPRLQAAAIAANGGAAAAMPSRSFFVGDSPAAARFICERAEEGHRHDASCGHFHAPDPRTLGDTFSWKSAILTVFSAGSRPCSGAILVLVFALAQGIFVAGIAATFAMSLGTAITTAALAVIAVMFKDVAVRLSGGSRRGERVARAVEFAAAVGVLVVGLALLLGVMQAGA